MGNAHLLIIDPQIDFCCPEGSLYVNGADKDMDRLARLIYNQAENISEITVTMDMHKRYHIANPVFWINESGENPEPYTILTAKDVEDGKWKAANKEHRAWGLKYLKTLEKNGRYQLCIWPYHCVIGTVGNNIYPAVLDALSFFECTHFKKVNYINKGSCCLTEHYSALFADVPIPHESSTHINKKLLISMAEADSVLVAGEALSHCVANSVTDIGNSLNRDLSKFTLLKDATSSVVGFEYLGDEFINRGISIGMKVSDTVNVMWGGML